MKTLFSSPTFNDHAVNIAALRLSLFDAENKCLTLEAKCMKGDIDE